MIQTKYDKCCYQSLVIKGDTIISFKAQIHTRKRMNAKDIKILKYEKKRYDVENNILIFKVIIMSI